MSTPIRIFQHEQLGLAVSGRELYSLVAITNAKDDKFSDWFRLRESRLSLGPDKDYVLSYVQLPTSIARRGSFEFTVTLEAAKKIAQWQPAGRGLGVLAYIKEYERNQKAVDSSAQTTTESVSSLPTTQTVALSSKLQTSAPKLNFDEALPELEKLSPNPIVSASAPTHVGSLSPVQQILQEVQKLAEAEKNRNVLPDSALTDIDKRVRAMEKKLNALVFFFQQSANALANFVPTPSAPEPAVISTPPTQSQSMRSKIVRLVEAWSSFNKVTHQEVWQWLYNRLFLQYRFDAYSYGKSKRDPNYLDIVEEHGQLENLYAIADSSLKTS